MICIWKLISNIEFCIWFLDCNIWGKVHAGINKNYECCQDQSSDLIRELTHLFSSVAKQGGFAVTRIFAHELRSEVGSAREGKLKKPNHFCLKSSDLQIDRSRSLERVRNCSQWLYWKRKIFNRTENNPTNTNPRSEVVFLRNEPQNTVAQIQNSPITLFTSVISREGIWARFEWWYLENGPSGIPSRFFQNEKPFNERFLV